MKGNTSGADSDLRVGELQTLAFAGGGNRCWWQAGVIERLREQGYSLPLELVGTSAGAAIAASCLTDGPRAALRACRSLYAQTERIFDWRACVSMKPAFAHHHVYPAWIEAFVHHGNFEVLKQARSRLSVAISRPARALGLVGSVAVGTLAYLVDKKIARSIHPRLPRWLGLRQEFVSLNDCRNVTQAQLALRAAAAAPPFMPSIRWADAWAFDGGYVDNAPLPAQTVQQRARTLVLLTRHDPGRPSSFVWQERRYWQPSRPVPVSTWDCTRKATVDDAFTHGYDDARAFVG